MSEKKYQVFISSTYEDLKEERQSAFGALMSIGKFIPIGMELFPAIDIKQLEYIEQQIAESDYYLLITGGRYGSLNENGISYTEAEYDLAKKHQIPCICLVHEDKGQLPNKKCEADHNLTQKLENFIQKVKEGRIVNFWKDTENLELKVYKSFASITDKIPRDGWIKGGKENSKLEKENIKLKEENANLLKKIGQKQTQNKEENYLEQGLSEKIEFQIIHYKDNETQYLKQSKISLQKLLKERGIDPQDEEDKELCASDLLEWDQTHEGEKEKIVLSYKEIFYNLASQTYPIDIAYEHDIMTCLENLTKGFAKTKIKSKPDIYVETWKIAPQFLAKFTLLNLIAKENVVSNQSFRLTSKGRELFEQEKLLRMSSGEF